MATYLRVTNWMHPATAMTVVMEATGLKTGDPYEAIESHLDAGFFVTYEIFECEAGDGGYLDGFAAATMQAVKRASEEEQRERNMAVAYFWYADALRLVEPNGVVASTQPAPLSREDMAWVMRSLTKHEHYQAQTVIVPLKDGTTITMRKGEVLPA
jgi:hypothetical protein